jgi:AcrR family transcriptional regulator
VNRASYNSPRRQEAAATTRQAIVEAAQALFAAQGYGRTTVAQIAELARVTADTVYASVGGKPQLLAVISEGGADDPDVAETLATVALTTDSAEVIRLTAAGTRRVNERRASRHSGPLHGVLASGWCARQVVQNSPGVAI